MRITESQLRRIVREEITKESMDAPDWRQEYADQKFDNRIPGPQERMLIPQLQKGDPVTVRGYQGRPIRGVDDTDPLDQGTLIPIGSEAIFVKRGPVMTQIIFKGRTLSINNGYLDAVR